MNFEFGTEWGNNIHIERKRTFKYHWPNFKPCFKKSAGVKWFFFFIFEHENHESGIVYLKSSINQIDSLHSNDRKYWNCGGP